MILAVASRQKPAMDRWMQCLDPAVEHFRELRDGGDLGHVESGIGEGFRSTAG